MISIGKICRIKMLSGNETSLVAVEVGLSHTKILSNVII